MKLLLQTPIPGGSDFERIIAAVCGPYCHAEILLSDGRSFSSVAPEGVRFLSSNEIQKKLETYPRHWSIIKLPWLETSEIYSWCNSIIGCDYDYRGAFSSGFGLATHRTGKWFCSEVCAEVISRANGINPPGLLCPTALGVWVRGLLAGTTPSVLKTLIRNKQNLLLREGMGSLPEGLSSDTLNKLFLDG